MSQEEKRQRHKPRKVTNQVTVKKQTGVAKKHTRIENSAAEFELKREKSSKITFKFHQT